MFIQAVPRALKSNLASLGNQNIIKQFYLAGGTALALQLGHRMSEDLDFFSAKQFDERAVISQLELLGNLTVDTRDASTMLGKLNDARISFFYYRYPLLFPPISFLGVNLADIRDIGAMKFDAIQSRGKKRDFIDLFALLCAGTSLEELLTYFEKKYAGAHYNQAHLLKSLTYFADAEGDDMPAMLTPITWNEVKQYIEDKAKLFTKNKF